MRRASADAPTTAPAPLLDQISHETQSLFQSVRPGLVRVELPPPKWIQPLSDPDNPMQKWGPRLDPGVLQRLQHDHLIGVEAYLATSQPASSQASTPQAATSQPEIASPVSQSVTTQPSGRETRTLVFTRPDGEIEFLSNGAPPYDPSMPPPSGPRVLGIVLDDKGHVLIPIFVEKEALQGRPLKVTCPQGKSVLATLIGSDRQTNLSVIQLERSVGTPISLAGIKPADGSLVMLLSPNGESGRLSIWTGGLQDRGLLITTSGEVGGFVRMGQFLGGDAMKPIANELIQYGKVRRATLGVLISQAETPDGHHAMRVEQVIDHSAAADVGLREGDYILFLAGSPVGDIPSFAAAIAERDGPTELQLIRDGAPLMVTANLKPK